jgi:hypothetical protein
MDCGSWNVQTLPALVALYFDKHDGRHACFQQFIGNLWGKLSGKADARDTRFFT